jgi:hypothetical protein
MTAKSNGGPPKRVFREFQFIIVPVLLVEEDGGVPFPQQGDQIVCRGVADLQAFIDQFADSLEQLNAKAAEA